MDNKISDFSIDSQIAAARQEFICDPAADLGSVARSHGLPPDTLAVAADKDDWNQQRITYFRNKSEQYNLQCREHASQRRLPMITTQIDLIERMQKQVLKLLESYDSGLDVMLTSEMRRITETLSGLTSNLSTLLGLGEVFDGKSKDTGPTNNHFYFPNARPIRNVEGSVSGPPY